ncbi:sortase domain-bontaining protein [Kallotenue papyrolyticum]|uniref:sortase domain-containing protein n=1 Tax=Kallotenue papyrolyticum TaxID=1325125 RepID=UPI00047863F7|nr:sortase [Kallotenue papyrolyticum]
MRSSLFYRLEQYARWREDLRSGMTTQRKILWTIGNLLILCGVALLLFVGGLVADHRYNVYAANGDTPELAPVITPMPQRAATAPVRRAETTAPPRERFEVPLLNQGASGALTSAAPPQNSAHARSTITRIVAPTIKLDKKVVEIGWSVEQIEGQEVAVWQVDKYRVGHHQGSSNPGEGGNIVLAGHSGGPDYPFNDIYYLKPGDPIELYANGQIYEYRVTDHILVDEVGQPLEKRLENARYIEPTDEEVVTMVACWPLTGPDKFKQRIIIRARPVGALLSGDQQEQSGWTVR